jgi:CheY-like chemotaxis protein/two-component sensor histidine kinase
VLGDVTDERRAQARQIVNDRLASVGMLAAGVAHEINNPLTCVLAEIEMAQARLGDPPTAVEHLGVALDAAHRVRTIVSDLRTLSREGTHDPQVPVDVTRAIDTALRMVAPQIRGRITLRCELDGAPRVLANEGRLVQVFLNLVANAAQAMPEDRPVDDRILHVKTGIGHNGGAVIDVSDNGSGMTAEVRARIFTPFFTTKPIGSGTGLGLSICQRIIAQLGGTIDCDSAPGRGTTFRIWVPRAPDDVVAPRTSFPHASAPTQRRRVLVVDEDPFVRQTITRALRGEHEVVAVDSADAAWTRIDAGEPFDLVLFDAHATGTEGIAFWERLGARHARVREGLVFLCPRTTSAETRDRLRGLGSHTVDKPIDVQGLRAFASRGLERREEGATP